MLSSSVWDVWARFGLSSRPVKASSRAWRLCGPHFLAQLKMGVCHQFILSIQPIHPKYPINIQRNLPQLLPTLFIIFSSNSHPILIQFSRSLSVSRCFPATRTMGLRRTSASDLGHHPVVVGSQARNEGFQWLPFGGFQWFPWGIPKMYGLQMFINVYNGKSMNIQLKWMSWNMLELTPMDWKPYLRHFATFSAEVSQHSLVRPKPCGLSRRRSRLIGAI